MDYVFGHCTRKPSSLPHHSETVAADIKEKEVAYKAVGASRTESGVKKGKEVSLLIEEGTEDGWFRGCSRNRVNPCAGVRISGPRHFHVDRFMPGEDCELDANTAMCVVVPDDSNDIWGIKSVRFDPGNYAGNDVSRPGRSGQSTDLSASSLE